MRITLIVHFVLMASRSVGFLSGVSASVVAGLVPATSHLFSNICDSYGIALR